MAPVRHNTDRLVRVLDPNGNVVNEADVPDLSDEELIDMYREMRLARHFDERAISLQRQGRMGTYTPLAGQEGAQIGSIHALDPEDWFIPSYREHGAKIARGMDPRDILLYWKGNEIGNQVPKDLNIFSVSITVGGHPPHAVGMAWASKLRGENRAFLCNFGDGATSEGDFHEGLNFAGVFNTPTVFLCNNNQWAISVPRERQTASKTLAQKATAYGFEGVQVDGMDPLAVYSVTQTAVEKAKNPEKNELRPTLIEAVMYRFGPHTTADDPSVYRDEAELNRWKEEDPLRRFSQFLRSRGLLDDERDDAIQTEVENEVAEAIEAAEAFDPHPESILTHVYAELPPHLEEELMRFNDLREKYGDDLGQE